MNYFLNKILVLTFFSLSACNPFYVAKLGVEEFKILNSRKSIEEEVELHNNNLSSLPKETITKLKLVKEIRDYSIELGLKPKESYTTYADLNDLKPIYVVTAAEQLALRPVTWWYPFVGSIPYKGYFDQEEALNFKLSLEQKSLDTSIRDTIAYSTLGWLNDPVLPSILKQSDLNIIITVFHEITHSTIWIEGHPDFNETLAQVSGLMSALEFIRNKRPDLLQELKKRISFECSLSKLLDKTYLELEELYQSTRPTDEKLSLKKAIFDKLLNEAKELKTQILAIPDNNTREQQPREEFNNATFISTYIYFKQLSLFLEYFQKIHQTSPAAFINAMSKINTSDPYHDLKKLLENDKKEPNKFECLDIKF